MQTAIRFTVLFCVTTIAVACGEVRADDGEQLQPVFRVGFAKRDITPPPGLPMWGYGARHDALADGVLDPLFAKAVVVHAGESKLALVGLDLGRGPTREMMKTIRKTIEADLGIAHVMISGSHTHHGPCIELLNREGFGKGRFDKAVAYNESLPGLIIDAIREADALAQPARIGVANKDVPLNRNRHTKRRPKPTDPMLAVMRFDDLQGQPIAILVNFAAHPVMTDEQSLKFSADYPGFLQNKIEQQLKTNCLFMQGASGDLSPNPSKGLREVQAFGEELAAEVFQLAESVETTVPATPSVQGKVNRLRFKSRTDFGNPLVAFAFQKAFYPELIRCFVEEYKNGIPTELNTVLLNGDIALVGGSGEFFCNHSVRLKQRSYFPHTLFFGYCNGHSMYFPTIEAASEGGYGADPAVSPVRIGAGERLMNLALMNLYSMAGRFATFDEFLKDVLKKTR